MREGVNGSDAVFLFLLGFSFTFRRAFLPFFYLLSGIPVFLLSLVGGGWWPVPGGYIETRRLPI